jgi:Leucine-rich repeat (LRR) protein
MKIKLLLGVLLLTFLQAVSQTTAIPDTNFEQALIDLGIDSDGTVNGQVLTADISGVTNLDVSNKNISDLTGIENFDSLGNLNCSNNQLISLDISNNASTLYWLNCDNNLLTNLDVSNNDYLLVLECKNNLLTSLNVRVERIQALYCQGNQLTVLDLSINTKIDTIFCYDNQLTSLDLSNNTLLKRINCYENQLTNLNVSNNLNLENLNCFTNQLTSLDITNNTKLKFLSCVDNNLSSLNTSNNNLLEDLFCSDNQISNLDLSQNPLLTFLTCDGNQLPNINISNNTALTTFWCQNNQIVSLDLSNHSSLFDVNCSNNQLSYLNIKNNNNSTILGGDYNDMNATNNPNLTCIQVDDITYSTTNWTNIDPQTSFSENCSIIWTSNAENNNDFAKIDSDTDTFNWEVDNAASRGSGARFFSKSWDSGAGNLTPDNLLITPTGEISIPVTATSISFKLNVEASNALRPAENFAIYVFDEAVGQSFDTKIYEETLTVGGDGTDKDISATIPSSFAGKNIGIIVRHYDCTGQDKLYVDNFEVSYEEFALSNKKTIAQKVNIYPNPTKHSINVSLKEKSNYTLININGKVIKTGTLTPQQNNIDISKAANGLYFLTLENENKLITKKIIKQ